MEVNSRCKAGVAALYTGFIFTQWGGRLSVQPLDQEYNEHVDHSLTSCWHGGQSRITPFLPAPVRISGARSCTCEQLCKKQSVHASKGNGVSVQGVISGGGKIVLLLPVFRSITLSVSNASVPSAALHVQGNVLVGNAYTAVVINCGYVTTIWYCDQRNPWHCIG